MKKGDRIFFEYGFGKHEGKIRGVAGDYIKVKKKGLFEGTFIIHKRRILGVVGE